MAVVVAAVAAAAAAAAARVAELQRWEGLGPDHGVSMIFPTPFLSRMKVGHKKNSEAWFCRLAGSSLRFR